MGKLNLDVVRLEVDGATVAAMKTGFGVGILRWNTRVETYLLRLFEEYPPFSLDQTEILAFAG